MLRKISLVIALGCGFALVASAAEVSPERQISSPIGCAAEPAMSWMFSDAPVLTSRGGTGEIGAASCCYSDPCPGWGGYMVSCCAQGCSAWSDRVWCSHTGFIYCPHPCASNGICYEPCSSSDPDCTCTCQQGAQCTDDSDCCGYTCVKESEFAIVGTCSC